MYLSNYYHLIHLFIYLNLKFTSLNNSPKFRSFKFNLISEFLKISDFRAKFLISKISVFPLIYLIISILFIYLF